MDTEFKVGDKVMSLFESNECDIGVIVELNTYLNDSDEYCHRVQWINNKELSNNDFHPKFLRKLTPLEQLL